MQEFFENEQLKMLKLSATRWFCLQHVVKKVLVNWDVLKHYFTLEIFEDKSPQAKFIHDNINDVTKAIFLFLNYLLHYLNMFNALFQGKRILIQDLASECRKLYKVLVSHLKKSEYTNDFNINCKNPRHFLDLNTMNLGPECTDLWLKLPNDKQEEIRKYCLNFLTCSAEEIQRRFPINANFFTALKFLSPQIALSNSRPDNLRSLRLVTTKFAKFNVDAVKIDWQWNMLPITFEDNKDLVNLSPDDFWNKVSDSKNPENVPLFKDLCGLPIFAYRLIVTPKLSAYFPLQDVKTKKRNCVGNDSLNVVAFIRMSHNDSCQNFTVTEVHEFVPIIIVMFFA